jgi:hypothetical protein
MHWKETFCRANWRYLAFWGPAYPCLCVRDRWMAKTRPNGYETNNDRITIWKTDVNEQAVILKVDSNNLGWAVYPWNRILVNSAGQYAPFFPTACSSYWKIAQLSFEKMTALRQLYKAPSPLNYAARRLKQSLDEINVDQALSPTRHFHISHECFVNMKSNHIESLIKSFVASGRGDRSQR